MGYEDKIAEKISSMGQRVDERLALWQAITESFEEDGADGVKDELAGRMNEIRNKCSAVLERLKGML